MTPDDAANAARLDGVIAANLAKVGIVPPEATAIIALPPHEREELLRTLGLNASGAPA